MVSSIGNWYGQGHTKTSFVFQVADFSENNPANDLRLYEFEPNIVRRIRIANRQM